MRDISGKLDIVVIGGSLAGLMASIALKRLGHRITILERSSTPLLHDQGAGIVAGGETQSFYQRHDLSQRSIAVTSKARYYLDRDGNIIDKEEYLQRMTSWDLLYFLGRANFDGIMSKYVDDSKFLETRIENTSRYEHGRSVIGLRDIEDKVEIVYEDTRQGSDKNETASIIADYVVVADGPSSRLRKLLLGEHASERTYAGYVAFRGTVPETELTPESAEIFVESFTFYHTEGIQILAYTIPGPNGAVEAGKRLVNWVWYYNAPESSDEYAEMMTDIDGNKHRWTLPTGGKMQAKVWERQKKQAAELLPPQFIEIVSKTRSPFVQAITDVKPPPSGTRIGRLLNGKATIIGDALSGFRPHTAASTSQAAFHALLLEKVFDGAMEWEDYEERVLDFAKAWQMRGVMLGNRSQFGRHPLAS